MSATPVLPDAAARRKDSPLETALGGVLVGVIGYGVAGWILSKMFGTHLPQHQTMWLMVGGTAALVVAFLLGGDDFMATPGRSRIERVERTMAGVMFACAVLAPVVDFSVGAVSAIAHHNYYAKAPSSGDGPSTNPYTPQECAVWRIMAQPGSETTQAQYEQAQRIVRDYCGG
jgi:hypothetical protein